MAVERGHRRSRSRSPSRDDSPDCNPRMIFDNDDHDRDHTTGVTIKRRRMVNGNTSLLQHVMHDSSSSASAATATIDSFSDRLTAIRTCSLLVTLPNDTQRHIIERTLDIIRSNPSLLTRVLLHVCQSSMPLPRELLQSLATDVTSSPSLMDRSLSSVMKRSFFHQPWPVSLFPSVFRYLVFGDMVGVIPLVCRQWLTSLQQSSTWRIMWPTNRRMTLSTLPSIKAITRIFPASLPAVRYLSLPLRLPVPAITALLQSCTHVQQLDVEMSSPGSGGDRSHHERTSLSLSLLSSLHTYRQYGGVLPTVWPCSIRTIIAHEMTMRNNWSVPAGITHIDVTVFKQRAPIILDDAAATLESMSLHLYDCHTVDTQLVDIRSVLSSSSSSSSSSSPGGITLPRLQRLTFVDESPSHHHESSRGVARLIAALCPSTLTYLSIPMRPHWIDNTVSNYTPHRLYDRVRVLELLYTNVRRDRDRESFMTTFNGWKHILQQSSQLMQLGIACSHDHDIMHDIADNLVTWTRLPPLIIFRNSINSVMDAVYRDYDTPVVTPSLPHHVDILIAIDHTSSVARSEFIAHPHHDRHILHQQLPVIPPSRPSSLSSHNGAYDHRSDTNYADKVIRIVGGFHHANLTRLVADRRCILRFTHWLADQDDAFAVMHPPSSTSSSSSPGGDIKYGSSSGGGDIGHRSSLDNRRLLARYGPNLSDTRSRWAFRPNLVDDIMMRRNAIRTSSSSQLTMCPFDKHDTKHGHHDMTAKVLSSSSSSLDRDCLCGITPSTWWQRDHLREYGRARNRNRSRSCGRERRDHDRHRRRRDRS